MAFQPIGLVHLVIGGGLEAVFQPGEEGVLNGLAAGGGDGALGGEFFRVEGADGLHFLDAGVHLRLGEGRLVALIMAVAAVADDVEHDIGMEIHAIFGDQAGGPDHGFRIVAIHMDDRRLDALGHIGAVKARIGIDRHGGEADLIVGDDVDGAAGAVAHQLRHRQRLIDQALAGEGGIAMQQDAHDRGALSGIARFVLPGADLADHHRVHRFEVAGVGLQREMDLPSIDLDIGAGAQMVFHIARAMHVIGIGRAAFEFGEDLGVGLLDHIHEHVEPAAMGHADGDLIGAELGGGFDDRLHGGDGGFAAFKAESLGADIFAGAEGLEALGLGQLGEDLLFFGRGIEAVPGRALDALLDPAFLAGILDMHEFNADRAAIGGAHPLDDLLDGRGFEPQHAIDEDGAVEVGLGGEAPEFRLEFGVGLGGL